MASVTSLGVHQPVGLQHAIDEGFLSPDPSPSSYTWEVIASNEDGREYEDELLTTANCVLWSRGGIFRKSFTFDLEKEPVTQALLAYFPASADGPAAASQPSASEKKSSQKPSDKPGLSRALVVFLKSQAHIYFLSGTSHVVHIPFEIESACAGPRGVIIQRKPRSEGTSVSLRLPKVAPTSFVSSQPPPIPRRSYGHGHDVTEFSTEGMGNPKVLPLRLSLTLENMFQPPMETNDSHWPRLRPRLSTSITSPEAPVDNLLEELRAGGDFEGFHNMGLDDHDFDGLAHEMLLTKISSVSMDTANMRYSMSSKPARMQAKVFILAGPPTATDDQGRALLLVAIQDPVDKRLQLLTLHLEQLEGRTPPKSKKKKIQEFSDFHIIPGEPRRVQSVVDSCKISDGNEAIMILSEDGNGGRELSLQSPWGKVTTVALPLLSKDNLSSLEFAGSYKAPRGQLPAGIDLTGSQIGVICHANSRGAVDLRDHEVRKVLDVCRSVLHTSYADKMVAGWWHVMQWLRDAKLRGLDHRFADTEWSAAVVLLLSSFLALGHNSETSLRTLAGEPLRPAAKNKWEAMQLRETPNSSPHPAWIQSKAWQWLLDGPSDIPNAHGAETWPSGSFIPFHVGLAKRWMASAGGLSAFGFEGYLPTALNRIGAPRDMAAWSIVLALHLLVEEQKLNILASKDSPAGQGDLKMLLYQLVKWLGWQRYEYMYALSMSAEPKVAQDLVPFIIPGLAEPPSDYCILSWIQAHLTGSRGVEFPTLADLYANATRDAVGGKLRKQLWDRLTPRTMMFERLFARLGSSSGRFEMVVAMHECGFTPRILETLPEGVLTPLQDVISICQPNPPLSWPKDLLTLVSRTDMSGVLQSSRTSRALGLEVMAPSHEANWDFRMLCQSLDNVHQEEPGSAERQAVIRVLFREDRRLNEAQNLLSTVKARIVRLDPKPEWTEPEYLERQKQLVTTVATSTLAIPAGQGLMQYALRFPMMTQKFRLAGFNLTCIVKPVNNTVSVDKSIFTEDKINWAFFHQGVAGGLAISPQAKGIDNNWILYNKPRQELSNSHAGFLLALGLNGHLKSIAKWVAFRYLTPKHPMTTVGLLLGLAASHIGTMDAVMTKLLSVHVTRMLPRGAADLNLSTLTQTTGVMGIGLVYCNSQHRRMSEIMLSEIEHVGEGEEDENPFRDESYRLAAGFALGLINLGKGNDLGGLRDMRVTEKLLALATSTKRVDIVNTLDHSAAGAVMAIALIYMKSEDQIVARKIDVPDTLLQFDYIRPDVLLLRTVAKNLILWKDMDPTYEWIKSGLPAEYRTRCQLGNVTKLQSKDLPFFSILAGLCFSLGLRFAGTADLKVRDLLIHYLDQFMRIVQIPVTNYDNELARNNARMCMDLLTLSCATVMAGTGDVPALRRLRALHGRDDTSTSYGSHLAAHLAIGALFLGCGTSTFGTSDLAVASLLISFYPLFPATVQDNRSHLQALRHFWVLATEPRCLVAKDIATNQPLNIPVLITLKPNTPSAAAATQTNPLNNNTPTLLTLRRQTPCLLPPLNDILRVQTDARSASLDYWDLTIDFASTPSLKSDFKTNQTVYLRRRLANERRGKKGRYE
ncbi:Anaphase-promoting complex subunit 1 [Collariella sp. IMI 366227]|nr:Anaphase-promoting complex subunit 1 [Collariella sp. IMI 366227]